MEISARAIASGIRTDIQTSELEWKLLHIDPRINFISVK